MQCHLKFIFPVACANVFGSDTSVQTKEAGSLVQSNLDRRFHDSSHICCSRDLSGDKPPASWTKFCSRWRPIPDPIFPHALYGENGSGNQTKSNCTAGIAPSAQTPYYIAFIGAVHMRFTRIANPFKKEYNLQRHKKMKNKHYFIQ